jgi:hypothetical protein
VAANARDKTVRAGTRETVSRQQSFVLFPGAKNSDARAGNHVRLSINRFRTSIAFRTYLGPCHEANTSCAAGCRAALYVSYCAFFRLPALALAGCECVWIGAAGQALAVPARCLDIIAHCISDILGSARRF